MKDTFLVSAAEIYRRFIFIFIHSTLKRTLLNSFSLFKAWWVCFLREHNTFVQYMRCKKKKSFGSKWKLFDEVESLLTFDDVVIALTPGTFMPLWSSELNRTIQLSFWIMYLYTGAYQPESKGSDRNRGQCLMCYSCCITAAFPYTLVTGAFTHSYLKVQQETSEL